MASNSTRGIGLRHLVRSAGIATVVMTLTITGLAGPAAAGPKPQPGGTADQLAVRQQPLTEAAQRIRTVIDEDRSNFAGMELAADGSGLRLYWKGTPPASVDRVVGEQRSRVPIRVLPAAYPLRELKAEAVRLVTAGPTSGIILAAPLADGSGLRVRVGSTASQTAARALTGIPLSIEVGAAPIPTSRWADTPEFWGGAAIERPINSTTRSLCTTGFAGRRNGQSVLLTAAHCGPSGSAWRTPTGTYYSSINVGSVNYRKPDLEAMFIAAPAQGRIYDGGVDPSGRGSGEFSKPVAGWAPPEVGQYVCQSGSFSGARCGMRVTLKWVTYSVNGVVVTNGVEAQKDDRTNAVGLGDSGGPVFRLSSDPNRVIAVGVQSAADPRTPTSCTGIANECYWRMYFAEMTQIVGQTGFTIATQ